jgi:hypothetical protein
MSSKEPDRQPILLSRHAVALIQIYDRTDDLADIMFSDYGVKSQHDISVEAAKEFVSQLKGRWCLGFLKALRDECDSIINGDA